MTETNAIERAEGRGWIAWRGDCVELMPGMPEGSVDLSVTSIPFANLFTYDSTPNDIGNARDHEEFFAHFAFMVREWFRITKPGRLMCTHLMNLPSLKQRDGYVGLIDFRGQVIKAYQDAGWIFTSEVVVWKDPVVAANRTNALGLLYKQIRKDSTMSRMGIPDTVVMFRKPGENASAVAHTFESFSLEQWQKWASPVWDDIEQYDTLQRESARDEKDERHVAPLQLEVIRRCVELYSNPGDVVFDPFGGIGSTGVVALEKTRRAAICELKESYWKQLVGNMKRAESEAAQPDLMSVMGMGAR